MVHWSEYIKLLVALLAIVDVPGNVPLFLQQTARLDHRGRCITAITAGVATAIILLTFQFVGEFLFAWFGISIAAFKVLGGIVVLLIALDMLGLLGGGDTRLDASDDASPVAIGVFPMAVPMFAGPGAIAAVLIYAAQEFDATDHPHNLVVAVVIISVSALIVIGLVAASFAGRFVGPVAQKVIDRLLGMVVGALGIEFVLEGLLAFFPALRV